MVETKSFFNPKIAEFNNPPSSLVLLIIFGISRLSANSIETGGCAGWPGSIYTGGKGQLNHFRFQQDKC